VQDFLNKLNNIQAQDILLYSICLVVLVMLYSIYMGLSDRAVFYFSKGDLFLSFSGWLVALISLALENLFRKDYLIPVGLSIGGVIELYALVLSVKYNRNKKITGFFIGITKIVLAFLFLLQIFSALDSGGKSRRRGNAVKSFFLLAIVGWFVKSLINGERVYEQNDWEYSH